MLPLNQIAILMMLVFAIGLGVTMVVISAFLGRVKRDPRKLSVYECGVPPSGSPRQRYSVKFYLVAIFFLIFDIEVVFLYPWALIFKSQMSPLMIFEMLFFIGILVSGYIYIWKKGALDWD